MWTNLHRVVVLLIGSRTSSIVLKTGFNSCKLYLNNVLTFQLSIEGQQIFFFQSMFSSAVVQYGWQSIHVDLVKIVVLKKE